MSFLSGLGKVLGVAAPFIAAPFTGGASLAAGGLGLMGKIGKVASAAAPALAGLAAGKQKGREAENTAAQDAATFALREREGNENALENRAGIDLKQRQFGIDSQNNAFKNALRSALAKNMQDVTLSGVPKGVTPVTYSGGARPSAIGQEGRDAASTMYDKAMLSLMNGEKFNPLPPIERTAAPVFKKPGAMENILGGLAAGTSAIAGARANSQQQDFQQKILDAIQAISGNQTPGAPSPVKLPVGGNGGVMPWGRIPTATFPAPKPVNPYDDGQ